MFARIISPLVGLNVSSPTAWLRKSEKIESRSSWIISCVENNGLYEKRRCLNLSGALNVGINAYHYMYGTAVDKANQLCNCMGRNGSGSAVRSQ